MLDVLFNMLFMKCCVICRLSSCIYIDDILVSRTSPMEHEQHLREVFTRLCLNNLTVNLEKCVIGQPSVNFLGHRVDSKGITTLLEKVSAIQ